jgi:hypothetical protein
MALTSEQRERLKAMIGVVIREAHATGVYQDTPAQLSYILTTATERTGLTELLTHAELRQLVLEGLGERISKNPEADETE